MHFFHFLRGIVNHIFKFPAYLDNAQRQEQTTRAIQLLSSSKLNLRGLITKLKVSVLIIKICFALFYLSLYNHTPKLSFGCLV